MQSCCKQSRKLPVEVWVPLLLEVGYRCPMPMDDCGEGWGKSSLEFHHIKPWATCQSHNPQDMIAVCPACHSRMDSGNIDSSVVHSLKKSLSSPHLHLDSHNGQVGFGKYS